MLPFRIVRRDQDVGAAATEEGWGAESEEGQIVDGGAVPGEVEGIEIARQERQEVAQQMGFTPLPAQQT